MGSGGEIHFGDTTTSSALGLTEGAWDQFGDTDRLGLYCRNELKIYGNSNVLRLTIPTNGDAAFASGATFTGSVGIGTDAPGAKLTIEGVGNELNSRSQTNANSQGTAQRNTIVSYYPQTTSATRLEIPVTSQGNLNSTTIMKIWGHSAKINDPNPLAFEATIQFGHLQSISNLSVLSSSGNIASVGFANNNPMEIFINFTTGYNNSNVNYSGCYVTIEYMTNNLSYSVIPGSIALN